MSDPILQQILEKLTQLELNMATKKDVGEVHQKLDKVYYDLKTSIESKHIENINSDNIVLKEIQEVKESIRFVNRRVADTELDLNLLKKSTQ